MAENGGNAGNNLKEKLNSQNGDNDQKPNVEDLAEGNELHSPHSFSWCSDKTKTTNTTCDKAGTVVEALEKSLQFKRIAKNNNGKELVVMKDGSVISSHFPCFLIKQGGNLILKYVKAADEPKKTTSPVSWRKKTPSDFVLFHVLTKGGKNVTRIMRNRELSKAFTEITVYALKGERVKDALRRDGRFYEDVFKKNCALSQRDTEVTTEFSNLVDDLADKFFQIVLLDKSNPPDSLDADAVPNDSQSDSEKGQAQKDERTGNVTPEQVFQKIPCSQQMQKKLCSEFEKSVKYMRGNPARLTRIQNMLRVEFGQNVERCSDVKTMKKLMNLSDSVCQVRINRNPVGSGFLLFDRYVFTSAHVIKEIYSDSQGELDQKVSVHFSYESVDQMGGSIDVEEVVCFDYVPDVSTSDFALLKVSGDQELPVGLLNFNSPLQEGGICIIGHPGGGVKKIDPCLVVPSHNRQQVVDRHHSENQGHIQLVTSAFFQDVAESVKQRLLTYESCFYHGSSGSPVFDKDCNVVAVHTGGHGYRNAKDEVDSVIEYGHPLAGVLEHLIIQIVQKRKFGVLKEYLSYGHNQDNGIKNDVKKRVESRNDTKFKEGISSLMSTEDQDLKEFCHFFSQKEEPLPMEKDC